MRRPTALQQAILAISGLGWVGAHSLAVDEKTARLRAVGMNSDQVARVLTSAKKRAERSTAPNGLAILIVLDVAIYKTARGDDLEAVVVELERIE